MGGERLLSTRNAPLRRLLCGILSVCYSTKAAIRMVSKRRTTNEQYPRTSKTIF